MKMFECATYDRACGALFAAEEAPKAGERCPEKIIFGACEVKEITTITDKDGQKYRVMLVPDLSEEVKKDG